MENPKVTILKCPIDNITMEQTLLLIKRSIVNKKKIKHVVVNAAKLVNMQKDKQLHDAVLSSDIINADGQSIVWASKLLGKPICERVTGIDLMQNIVKMAFNEKYRIFFLGATEQVINDLIQHYSTQYSSEIIAGYHHGYFSKEEESEIAMNIKQCSPDILFLALTSPKKEIFLENYKTIIDIPFIMGVGGSFDVISGKTKRAPLWMQKWGFEWLYRLLQEPQRMWKRYLITNTLFIYEIFKSIITKRGVSEYER